MIINPIVAINEGWVTGIADQDTQLQPNGIDYTADKMFELTSPNFILYTDSKVMGESVEMEPSVTMFNPQDLDDSPARHCYRVEEGVVDVLSNMYVELPSNVAAMLFTRSTLARNGLFTHNGLYDAGFKGHIGTVLHCRSGRGALIEQGARIGQIVFVTADSAHNYEGQYSHDHGTTLGYQK